MSTDEQTLSGAGLAAQRAALESEAARRGLPLLTVHANEGISGKSITGRPALAAALAELDTGRGTVLSARTAV